MATLTLSLALVSGTDNDLAANLVLFEEAYTALLEERAASFDMIATAVDEVFDTHNKAPLAMPTLVNFAMQRLSYTPETFKALSDSVADYVRENADRHEKTDKETGVIIQAAEKAGTRKFKIAKGKGGGVSRHVKA
jgi:hypothetical protein